MSQPNVNHRFCVAPMMDWSDRHCRYLWRLLSKNARLYTEMVTTGALLHQAPERFLAFNDKEHPVALQLGGSDATALAKCVLMAEQWGYDEVNLNCGCPSDRVQNGMIGACLMAHPQTVSEVIQAMRAVATVPITIKHRIGIDDMEDYQGLKDFVTAVAAAGCETFIIHARKAWLQGLSPKQNREVPPLRYDQVYRLKQEFPELNIVINGGITSIEQCKNHLAHVDGVMVGREAYHNPYLLAEVDQLLFGNDNAFPSRITVLSQYIDYCRAQLANGVRLQHMSKHVLGLFQGVTGARAFRRHISENAHKQGASITVLEDAMTLVDSTHSSA